MGAFRDLFSGWHIILVLVVIVVLFGAARLPVFAKSLGQSMRIFRREMKTMGDESEEDKAAKADGTVNSETPSETTPRSSDTSAKQ